MSTSGQRKHGRSVREQAQDEFSSQDILAMFNFVSDAMAWIKDREYRYRWANRTLLLSFSFFDESQILGKTDHDFNPSYLADLYQADDSRVLRGETIVARVEPVGTCEALPCWNQTWKLPLRNSRGQIIGTFGLSRPLPSTDSPSFPFPDLVPVLNHMRACCGRRITNGDLAGLVDLSIRAFEREFKRHMQMTPRQFLNRLRITRAAADLCHTPCSIKEIARRHGFSDQSHLTREFRKHFGTTPMSYRKSHFADPGSD